MWVCPNCESGIPDQQVELMWTGGWRCSSCYMGLAYQDGFPCFSPGLIGDVSTFDPTLFADLVRFEETSFWFVCRAWLIQHLLARYFPRADKMLEVGCGTGSVLKALHRSQPNLQLHGSELHPEGLRFAQQRLKHGIRLAQMDARQIPAASEFDVIGAFDVIEHIPDDTAVLTQMRKALRPFGGIILTVPQHPWLWSPADEAAHHQRRYRRGELESRVARAGFEVLFSTSFNSVLLPLMLVSRRRQIRDKRKSRQMKPLAEFEMSPLFNAILKAALMAEVRMTSHKMRWPIGGSRVVVAAAC